MRKGKKEKKEKEKEDISNGTTNNRANKCTNQNRTCHYTLLICVHILIVNNENIKEKWKHRCEM